MTTSAASAVPTQVTHPWKATLRTAAQALISVLTLAVVAWPIFQDFLVQVGVEASGFYAWTVAAGTVIAALAAGIARLMALPQLDALLQVVGFGAVPRGTTAVEQLADIAVANQMTVAVADAVPAADKVDGHLTALGIYPDGDSVELASAPDPAKAGD